VTATPLARKTFPFSRLAEFASTTEPARATGHAIKRWPLIMRVLIDHALAEAEQVAPKAPSSSISAAPPSSTRAGKCA
jgi:hypothetical protein